MNIGKLRKRLTIKRPVESRSMTGEATLSWVDVDTVWASVEGLSSRDVLQSQQTEMIATHRIRIRYRNDVLHTHRGEVDGRTMEFSTVLPKENYTVLEILAREVQ